MVLDIAQFLVNNISREMKISHFDCKVFCGKTSKVKSSIRSKLIDAYGEAYLEDAQYLIIVSGEAVKASDAKTKLFGILNRALGEVANNMAKSDVKDLKEKDDDGNETIAFRFLKISTK